MNSPKSPCRQSVVKILKYLFCPCSKNEKCPKLGNFLVAWEIFICYAEEHFPLLLGRKGTFDREGVYLSVI